MTNDGRIYSNLVSGEKVRDIYYTGLVSDQLRVTTGWPPGESISGDANHAEQKFAAMMITDKISSANLVINNPNGPCNISKSSCSATLNDILGDRSLTVWHPDGSDGWIPTSFGRTP